MILSEMERNHLIKQVNLINVLSVSNIKDDKVIFVDLIELCSCFLDMVVEGNLIKAKKYLDKISSFPRFYLEQYSDWGNPVFKEVDNLVNYFNACQADNNANKH